MCAAWRRSARTLVRIAVTSLLLSLPLSLPLSLLLGVGFAAPASAHAADEAPASNYVTTITGLRSTPAASEPGFRLRSIEAGSRLELRWTSGPEVQVSDYDGFPYLRIGRNGVYANTQSNAYYLNADRNGATPIPDGVDPEAAPKWKQLTTEPVERWHDHRAHWMGSTVPPQVQRNPGREHVVQENTIAISQGSVAWTASVQVRWLPGPSPWPWYGGIALVTASVLALSVGSSPARQARRYVAVASLLTLLVVVDASHLGGVALGVSGTTAERLQRLSGVGLASVASWIGGLFGAVLLVRRRQDGFYLATFAGGLIAVVGGIADLSVLSRTSVVFAGPPVLARLAVAATLALGGVVVVLSVIGTQVRRDAETRQPQRDRP